MYVYCNNVNNAFGNFYKILKLSRIMRFLFSKRIQSQNELNDQVSPYTIRKLHLGVSCKVLTSSMEYCFLHFGQLGAAPLK